MTILGHFNEKIEKMMIKVSRKNNPVPGPGHFYLKNIKISDPSPGHGTGKSTGHVPGHFLRTVVARSCPGPVPFSVSGTEELL